MSFKKVMICGGGLVGTSTLVQALREEYSGIVILNEESSSEKLKSESMKEKPLALREPMRVVKDKKLTRVERRKIMRCKVRKGKK